MIDIIAFGQIAAITGSRLQLTDITDTDVLQQELFRQFPALKEKKFAIAVDKKLINEPTLIAQNATVALLPPFSGG